MRRALGVARWNVVGESYGTTVAMTLLAHHPDSIRSAVPDSLNPPDAFFGMVGPCGWPMHGRRSWRHAAAADPAWGVRPGIADDTSWPWPTEQKPSFVLLPPEVHVPDNRVRLTPSLFEGVVGRLVYYHPPTPNCPALDHRDP